MALKAKHQQTGFSVGDLVKVHQKIVESGKERSQVFEGLVISIRGRGENKTFTVRRIASGGVGVEKIWPLNSPWVLKIEVLRQAKVRRAKLYYLRSRVGRKAVKVKTKKETEVKKTTVDQKSKKDEKKHLKKTVKKSRSSRGRASR